MCFHTHNPRRIDVPTPTSPPPLPSNHHWQTCCINSIPFPCSLSRLAGTVLYLCSLFERDETLPPVLSFSMGSLGFLTPFDAADYDSILQMVFDTDVSPLHCTLRTRKRCEVVLEGELQVRIHHIHYKPEMFVVYYKPEMFIVYYHFSCK